MLRDKEPLENRSVGIVETKYFTFESLLLENGEKFGPITIAYETYGELNKDKSNAVLILHALSGDAHAAGFYKNDKNPGWWDTIIGPGKGIDTDKYFVISSNILGGCKGSTGPSSISPKTGLPYALDFPLITIEDMVNAQKKLVDYLGIDKLLSVIGGSMGGMQALAWLVKYPENIKSAIPVATAIKHSPQQIAFDEVARQSIMADPNWKDGNYYDGIPPNKGLAVARMIGHITYMSDISMSEKFGRVRTNGSNPFKFTPFRDSADEAKSNSESPVPEELNKPKDKIASKSLTGFTADFEVEGYLRYRGDNFVKRFDANSFLYITKAMDNFDASGGKDFYESIRGIDTKILVIAFKSDWLYPAYQSKEIVKACKRSGIDASYCEIDSSYGHDAFLLEVPHEAHLISHFLKKVYSSCEVKYGH